jgi:hypothetical protein
MYSWIRISSNIHPFLSNPDRIQISAIQMDKSGILVIRTSPYSRPLDSMQRYTGKPPSPVVWETCVMTLLSLTQVAT